MIKEAIDTATRRLGREFYWLVRGDPQLFHEAPKKLPTDVRKLWAESNKEVAALLGPIYPLPEPDLTGRIVLGQWLTAFLTIQKNDQTKLLSGAQKNQYQYRVGGVCGEICTQRISQAFPNLDKSGIDQYSVMAIKGAVNIWNLVNPPSLDGDLVLATINKALDNLRLVLLPKTFV